MTLKSIVAVSRHTELQQLASKYAQRVLVADDPKEALELAVSSGCDLALFDDVFTPGDIKHFISRTDNHNIDIPVLIVSSNIKNDDLTGQFIQAGALDYLCKENEIHRLHEMVNDLNDDQSKTDKKSPCGFFMDEIAASVRLAGQSISIKQTLEMIKLVGSSQCNPVLILGETGTGKEVAARAVSTIRNPGKNFVAMNCAALTANLLESELFGHVKGSFTGADKDKTGLLELAQDGVVFLDEISEMPLELQAKLLRVLQEKCFRKVGGTKTIQCKATIIASSNRNLLEEVQENKFRRDLYYRLNICPIKMPALRNEHRKDDIEILARHFLKNSEIWPEKSAKIKALTPLAIEALEKHHWPGNVRELKNVIDRAILLEKTDKIGLSSIIIDTIESHQQSLNTTDNSIKDFSLAAAEKELIARALRETGWQKTKAATLLGITRATLYAKVKQYNIEPAIKDSYNISQNMPDDEPVAIS